ncbi:MAG: CBS domain-containing protein [Bacteroidetes bacterium]|nr:CBS domain-containing protein [Bacteroidota bacterium]
MKVKDILNSKGRSLFSVTEDSTIENTVAALAANKIGFLIVKDGSNAITGVISERDIVHRCMSAKKDPRTVTAKEIMTLREHLVTANEDQEIDEIMTLMTEKKIRHLPVFQGKELTGLISIGDVVKIILDDKNEEIKTLMDYVSR